MEKVKRIVEMLNIKNETISIMESCTGGYLVNEITNVETASNILKFSAVTYSNEYKIKLGVSKETIDKFTVYSKETSKEMAKAISDYTKSDYGIGITGKLNKEDKNNLEGKNNEVFYTIYDKRNNQYYSFNILVKNE